MNTHLPNLPQGIKNGVSGQTDQRIFIGLGSAGQALYSLDLAAPAQGWAAMPAFPGPVREGAAAAMAVGKLYVASGLGKAAPDDLAHSVLQDVYGFDPAANCWSKLNTTTPVGLLGATGFALDDDRIAFVGGVNTEIFNGFMLASVTIDKHKTPEVWQGIVDAFMGMSPEAHTWNTKLLVYTISTNEWSDLGDNPYLPNTGAALAPEAGGYLLINGEIKPGLRTPQVKHIRIQGDKAIWTEKEPLPPPTGNAIQDGLAGAFSGHSNGALIVAGGTNFHGSRAVAASGEWFAHRGLRKVWNRDIYAHKDGRWAVIGQLPKGLAYGASFNTPQGLLIVGGEDENQVASDNVLLLIWDELQDYVMWTHTLAGTDLLSKDTPAGTTR